MARGGKNIIKTKCKPTKKGEKERKDNVSLNYGKLGKNAGSRGHNIIYFPLLFNCRTKKSTKIQQGVNI